MDYNYKQTNLSKAIFGGLFAGLIACGAAQIFNVIFRYITDYEPSEMINVQTLIFAPILVCVIAGIIYFMLTKFVKQGKLIYQILFIILTIVFVLVGFNANLKEGPHDTKLFRELHTCIIIILGIVTVFVLPYVTKHDVMNE